MIIIIQAAETWGIKLKKYPRTSKKRKYEEKEKSMWEI